MSPRRFVILVILGCIAFHALAYAAHLAHSGSDDNVLVLEHQLSKLSDPGASDTEIVVLGDSGAGNAIHAPTFSELTGSPTQSLALTASFGFIGDYALIQRAQQAWPKLHTVVILHTLDIWRRRESPNAFARVYAPELDFSLVKGRESGWLERFKVRTNLKELLWFAEGLLSPPDPLTFSPETGYPMQTGEAFATGARTIDPGESLRSAIHRDKVDMFDTLDALAERTGLRVIYAHAPLHEGVAGNSWAIIEQVNQILAGAHALRAVPEITTYPDEMMGNRTDHVWPPVQREVTRDYHELLKPQLED